jgi:formate/nitrite transporter FocA (FNT family)
MAFRLRRRRHEEEQEAAAPAEAPAEQSQKNLSRPSAEEIYRQVAKSARQELKRTSVALAISGFAGGTFMGLSALGTAIALAMLTPVGGTASGPVEMIAKMFYPIGFIVVILGRSQLFTENTLYPVALVLAERKHFWNTARLWCVVLPSNVLGALAFAALATRTGALSPAVVHSLAQLGLETISRPTSTIFWSGVMGGWIIATVAWLVSGSHSITGSVMVIFLLTYVVGLGNFAHCIAASGEVFAAVLTGQAGWGAYPAWLGPAVAGNICGGVGMVTLLEYGQVIYGKDAEAEAIPVSTPVTTTQTLE